MGTLSKRNHALESLERWRRLSKKSFLSPEFAHQIARNIGEKTPAAKNFKVNQSPDIMPVKKSFFNRFMEWAEHPFSKKPSQYKGVN